MARKQSHKPRPITAVRQMQATKPKPTALSVTSPDVAVDVKQSIELVQTLVHGAISSLAFLRHLFGDYCFDTHLYEVNNKQQLYSDYANGLDQVMDKDSKRPASRFQVLKRGRSERVDQLLDWLEKGAFDALKRNVLRSLQLSLFEDPEQPLNVFELYTFTFHYTPSEHGENVISGMEVAGPHGQKTTVKTAKLAMHTLIRSIVQLCGTMPALPESRFVRMHLLYTDDRPDNYEPPGFHKATDDRIFFPDASWKQTSSNCGTRDLGFYKVSLKISHILPCDLGDDARNNKVEEQFHIPNKLAYTKPVDREDDVANDSGEEETRPTNHITKGLFVQNRTQSENSHRTDPVLDERATVQPQPLVRKSGLEGNRSPGDVTNSGSSTSPEVDLNVISNPALRNDYMPQLQDRSSTPHPQPQTMENEVTPDVRAELSKMATTPSLRPEDLRIKERLQHMLNPSNQEHNTEETQHLNDSIEESVIPNFPSQQVQLSQTKIQQLETHRSNLLPPRRCATNLRRRSESLGVGSDGDTINCQCEHNEEEDDMINCSFCDTWQHLHCYGYRGSDDPRIPTVHACYDCLLQGAEHELLRELRCLALCRRAIHILQGQEVTNDKELANVLHCDLQTATGVTSHFRKEKYLVPSSGPKKASSGKRFSLNKDEGVVALMVKEYFDPLAKISHHVGHMNLLYWHGLIQSG
ncbi:HORMA domain-domain-containing protein [Clohesyomyces aquaticus]|uniref:HORMA domain-domain-containing protein n=1 Tax=Clohesyomyces aquaticus TaxID=1231657 RepID=A0A1Y1ZS90_9PLEO|nr:HORMA domain-domain-containing protein [Clohesyomyces aquaticus]